MKRISKIIICTLTIAIIVCSCVTPCFAERDWSSDIGRTSVLITPTPRNAIIEGWASEETTNMLKEIATYAYESNAFNGCRPIAIYYESTNSLGGNVFFVTNSTLYPLANYENTRATFLWDDSLEKKILALSDEPGIASPAQIELKLYRLAENGSMIPYLTNTATFNINFDLSSKLLYAYYDGSRWVSNPNDEYFMGYYQNQKVPSDDGQLVTPSNNAPTIIKDMLSTWEANSTDTVTIEHPSYTLDIPGIITAIPNAAKQIINKAFGFEVFGINIAGLLSVLLIVTIAAFVVKWLMSR